MKKGRMGRNVKERKGRGAQKKVVLEYENKKRVITCPKSILL